jgi:parallel beta-helix repeat protein
MLIQKVKYRFFKVIFLSLIMISVLAGVTHSAEITVKQYGGGDYDNIGAAITNANYDDRIIVYPGIYEEAVEINKDLSLIGLGPQVVTIDSRPNGNTADGITINEYIAASVIGFTITSDHDGISLKANSTCIIRNNCIVSNGRDGIRFAGASAEASIINNVIYKNNNNGIYSYGDYNAKPYIHNNIISENGDYGLLLHLAASTISHNNVYLNTTGNYIHCSPGTGDISEYPRFFNPDIGRFELISNSLCINAGRPGSADIDPDGSRNDMGAYGGTYCASFWPYPPGAPIITNLNATPTSVPKGSPITIEATGEVYE